MLSNAYFLARFRFDTAENEPAKNLQKIANFPNFADPAETAETPTRRAGGGRRRPCGTRAAGAAPRGAAREAGGSVVPRSGLFKVFDEDAFFSESVTLLQRRTHNAH